MSEYEANFGSTRELGISVKTGVLHDSDDAAVVVTGVAMDLPRSLGIEVGDFLVAVNGVRCVGMLFGNKTSPKLVAKLVKTANAPRVLRFRRYESVAPEPERPPTAREARSEEAAVRAGVKTGVFSAVRLAPAGRTRGAGAAAANALADVPEPMPMPTPPRSSRRRRLPQSAAAAIAESPLPSPSPSPLPLPSSPRAATAFAAVAVAAGAGPSRALSLKPSLLMLMVLASFVRALPSLAKPGVGGIALLCASPSWTRVALSVAVLLFLATLRCERDRVTLLFRIAASLWLASGVYFGVAQYVAEGAVLWVLGAHWG